MPLQPQKLELFQLFDDGIKKICGGKNADKIENTTQCSIDIQTTAIL
jgi:hypothetical protein